MNTATLSINVYRGATLVASHTDLSQEVVKIGRLKSCHLCLEDEALARMHAIIERTDDELRAIDLGSPGGISVNGARLSLRTNTPVLRIASCSSRASLLNSASSRRVALRSRVVGRSTSPPQRSGCSSAATRPIPQVIAWSGFMIVSAWPIETPPRVKTHSGASSEASPRA